MRYKRLITIFTLLIILFFINTVSAEIPNDMQTEDADSEYTFYVGPVLQYISISGDFNGKSEIYDAATRTANQITILPIIESALGYGVLAGVRKDYISVEFTYTSSSHNAYRSYVYRNTNKTNAELNILSIDAKYYIIEKSKFQPYLQFGLTFPWIMIGSTTTKNEFTATDYEIIRFSGIGLNIGAGLMIDLEYVYINLNLYLRSFEFYQTRTNTTTAYQYYPVSGLNLIPSLSVLYKF